MKNELTGWEDMEYYFEELVRRGRNGKRPILFLVLIENDNQQ